MLMGRAAASRAVIAGALVAACTTPDRVVVKAARVCGDWTTDKYLADSASGAFGGVGGFATGVGEGVRIYAWTHQVTGMCVSSDRADNAIQFDLQFRSNVPSDFSVTGFVYGSVAAGAEPTAVATIRGTGATRIAYTGLVESIDLAPASSDGKSASLLVEVQVAFPTTGTAAGDLARLKTELLSIRMETFFHQYIGT